MLIGAGIFFKTQYDEIEKNNQETKTETQEVKENGFDINAANGIEF